jgi:sphingomyelin phosphodiesterase 2
MAVALAAGFVIAAPFLRSGWASLATLGAVACGWLGTTMLYEGVLYGRWERNALRNGIEELEIFRKGLAAGVDATTRAGVAARDEAGDRLPGVGW